MVDHCFWGVCFFPLHDEAPKIFGFSEFLAGLALMVLAWTIADVRYRFRISAAPIPLQPITFGVVFIVGVLSLLTDLWRANEWLVPEGGLVSPSSWQAILGFIFLMTFMVWAWFAFIRPPKFGVGNAKAFSDSIFKFVLRGVPLELGVIADELGNSANAIVFNATDIQRLTVKNNGQPLPKMENLANELLLLLADKRLCRAIVESSPDTALKIFQAMGEQKKYSIPIGAFAGNIVEEAIANKNSFIYHEAEGFESGLMGHRKPLSRAIFSNSDLVEAVRSILDPPFSSMVGWDSDQWEAHCRAVRLTLVDHTRRHPDKIAPCLFKAVDIVQYASSNFYKHNGLSNFWGSDSVRRLHVITSFVRDSVTVLDGAGIPKNLPPRKNEAYFYASESIYDQFAGLIFETIFNLGAVKAPRSECWHIQYTFWNDVFRRGLSGPAGRVIHYRVRRMVYDELRGMYDVPNFKGANIVAFLLNVMAFGPGHKEENRDVGVFRRVFLRWLRINFAKVYGANDHVADACFVEGVFYDPQKACLVKTFPPNAFYKDQRESFIEVRAL